MNINILSNSPTRVNSGFGIVARNLGLGLTKIGHTVSYSDMQNFYNKEWWNGMAIYPMNSLQGITTGNDFYTSELKQFDYNLKDSKSDVVIIIYPSYNDVVASNHLHEVHKNTIWYYPVEGENLPQVYTNELKKVSTVVPMTKQGKSELEKSNLSNINNEIYHGYDDKIFHKLNSNNESHYCKWRTDKYQLAQDKKWLCKKGCYLCNGLNTNCDSFKEEEFTINVFGNEHTGQISNLQLFKDQFGIDTIFGFVGDNNGKRKKIDRLLDSYSLLCKSEGIKKSETLLLLHTMPVSDTGLDLWNVVKKYDLNGCNILFVYGEDELGNTWSNEALNIFYNSIDINISCSSAEGFGLPTIESMAVGKPNIAPNFSSFKELIKDDNNDRGLLADIQGYEILSNKMKRALVSSKSVANLMSTIENDKSLQHRYGDNAYNWIQQYKWENVCKQFDTLLRNFAA